MIVWRLAVGGAMAGGAVALGWATVVPIAHVEPSSDARLPAVQRSAELRAGHDSAAPWLVRHAPFRAARRPAAVNSDALRQVEPPTAPAAKPVLVLVGVALGQEPTAVIEGFPGVEGSRVVRAGDVIGGLRVAGIAEQGVRIVGLDTVWVLTVRKTWR